MPCWQDFLTKSDFEWLIDATIPQVPVPLAWYGKGGFALARVHVGILAILCMLAEQIIAAGEQFDPSLPCLVTGHSLGGALSVLASPLIWILTKNKSIRMYSFASPRVANAAFAASYNELVPESYRVVNLADAAPILPPARVFSWEYAHVGEQWSFLNQSGDVGGNHALIGANNYTDAVKNRIPTNAPRTYPVTGLP